MMNTSLEISSGISAVRRIQEVLNITKTNHVPMQSYETNVTGAVRVRKTPSPSSRMSALLSAKRTLRSFENANN